MKAGMYSLRDVSWAGGLGGFDRDMLAYDMKPSRGRDYSTSGSDVEPNIKFERA